MRRPTPSGCIGRRLVWLLDLDVGGQTLRYAAEALEAPGPDGTTLAYSAGLVAPDYVDEAGDVGASIQPRSASVSILFEAGEFQAHRALTRGADLNGSRAILRLWVEDSAQYAVWLDGVAVSPEFGGPDEPVDLTISEAMEDDAGTIPATPTSRVSVATWSSYATRADGAWYPRVYGHPGGIFNGSSHRQASPALLVDTIGDGASVGSRALISELIAAADGPVRLKDITTGAQEDCGVVQELDAAGNLVSLCQLATVGAIMTHADYDPESAELWVSWWAGSGAGNRNGVDGLQGCGEILCHALGASTLRIDWGRVRAVAAWLDSLAVDVVISVSEPVSPWQWVSTALLPLQPLGAALGPDGVYLVRWRDDAIPADAEYAVVASCWDPENGTFVQGTAERLDRMSASDPTELRNDITLRYQYVGHDARYMGRMRATGDPVAEEADSLASLNRWCHVSRTRYRVRGQPVTRAEEQRADAVWDDATAAAVLAEIVRRLALPYLTVSYRVGPDAAHLSPGSVVTVEDAEVGINGIVAIVKRMTWRADGMIDLGLRWRALPTAG